MEQLTRGQFLELTPDKQIEHINTRRNNGEKAIDIGKSFGFSREGFRRHISDIGYVFDNKTKIYKKSTDVENNKNVLNTEVEAKFYNSREVVVDKEQFNLMLKSYKEIEKMNEKLEKVYQWYEREHDVIDVTPQELKIGKFEGEAVPRSYKFYPDIQKDFIEFCKKHRQYKSQDIICQALREFMDKY